VALESIARHSPPWTEKRAVVSDSVGATCRQQAAALA